MSIATRRNIEILLSERCVNNSFAMTDVTPVDGREGGEIVSRREKVTERTDAMAWFRRADDSGMTARRDRRWNFCLEMGTF